MDRIDPSAISPTHWQMLQRTIVLLAWFAVAVLAAAASFTAGRAVIPSLRGTRELPAPALRCARPAILVAGAATVVALLAAAWLLWQALAGSVAILRDVYPRFAV